jgi:hypothetical protein
VTETGKSSGADGEKRRRLRIRWGRVEYVEEEASEESPTAADDEEAPLVATETPGQRVSRERREAERRRHLRLRIALYLSLSAILVMGLQLVVMRIDRDVLEAPPPDIIGTWETDDPRYEDKDFVISAEHLAIGYGDGQSSTHVIRSISAEQTGDTWAYEITYGSPDGDQAFDFFLRPGGVLQLRNPPEVVWRRRPSQGGG